MQDRRRHQRSACHYPVDYCRVDREESAPPVQTHSLDASEGGLAIATPGPLEPGETLSLELLPNAHRRAVLAIARVVFSRRAEDGWLTGVELTWIDGGALTPGNQGQAQGMWSLL